LGCSARAIAEACKECDWIKPAEPFTPQDERALYLRQPKSMPLKFIFNRAIRLPCRRHLNIVAVNVARCPGASITSS
jgi:hypothetical protein